MPIPQKDVVDVSFWIKDDDLSFYGFVKNLKDYMNQFKEKVDLSFRFYSNGGDKEEKAKLETMANCMDIEEVFDFIGLYGDNCAKNKIFTSACLQEQAGALTQKGYMRFQRCLTVGGSKSVTKAMANLKALGKETKSNIKINQKKFVGSLKPVNIFEAVCGGFIKSPDNCLYLNNKYTASLSYEKFRNDKRLKKYAVILINFLVVFLLLVLAAGAMLIIFSRIYNRILHERVADMVKDSISNYQTLKDNV